MGMFNVFGMPILQDNLLHPILIFLIYDYHILWFPVNPEEITKVTKSQSKTVTFHNSGERTVPFPRNLSTIQIKSFFYTAFAMVTEPNSAVEWIERWRDSSKPAKLLVCGLNFTMNVTCENFTYSVKAGESEDIYFTLDLKEFIPFKIKSYTTLKPTKQTTDATIPEQKVDVTNENEVTTTQPPNNYEEIKNPTSAKKNRTLPVNKGDVIVTKDGWSGYSMPEDVDSANIIWDSLTDEQKNRFCNDVVKNPKYCDEGGLLTEAGYDYVVNSEFGTIDITDKLREENKGFPTTNGGRVKYVSASQANSPDLAYGAYERDRLMWDEIVLYRTGLFLE